MGGPCQERIIDMNLSKTAHKQLQDYAYHVGGTLLRQIFNLILCFGGRSIPWQEINGNLKTINEIAEHVRYDRRTLKKLIDRQDFPRRVVTVNENQPVDLWYLPDVEAWIDGEHENDSPGTPSGTP